MKEKVQCIVAPYEADAQLAYLMKTNKVDAVITEDSDLIAFGCTKLIYKMDRFGQGIEIKHQDIFTDFSIGLRLFDPDLLRRACIASGCDYLPSLRGVGLKTAILAFKRYADTENVSSEQLAYELFVLTHCCM
jgi:exonuclease-1